MTRARALISSTAGGLDPYRQAAVDICHRYGVEPVFMEEFVPTRLSVEESCLRRVAECTVVVLLLAHRYGTIAPGDTRSFTEIEYDAALTRPDIEVMAWVVDRDQPWPPTDVDTGELKDRLDAFKVRAARHVVGSLTTVAHFREDLGVALAELQIIQRGVPDETAGPLLFASTRQVPVLPDIAAFPAYVGSMRFTGRAQEQGWLDRWAASDSAIAVVEAIGGEGKSALAWQWFQQSAPEAIATLAGRLWWSFYEPGSSVRRLMEAILMYVTGCSRQAAEALDTVTLRDAVINELEAQPFLLVLDGFERLLQAYLRYDADIVTDQVIGADTSKPARALIDPDDHRFVLRLASLRSSRVLITSRLFPAVLEGYGNSPVPGVAHLPLHGLAPPDTAAIMRHLGISYETAPLTAFFDRVAHHPLVVGVVAGLVLNYRTAPGEFQRWLSDPLEGGRFTIGSLPPLRLRNDLLRYALDGLPASTLRLLQRIAAANGPTSWAMVKVLNPFLPTELPDSWAALPPYLRAHLAERRAQLDNDLQRQTVDAVQALHVALADLQDRGLLWWDRQANSYDLHPVVRSVVWDSTDPIERRATNRKLLREHYGRIEPAVTRGEESTVENLTPFVQRFRVMLGAEDFAGAARAWATMLNKELVYRLAATAVVIPLLREAEAAAPRIAGVSPFAWDLAVSEQQAGHLSEALAMWASVLRCALAQPGPPSRYVLPALRNLALIAEELDRFAWVQTYSDQLAAITDLSESGPGDRARVDEMRAAALLRQGRHAEAVEAFEGLLCGPVNTQRPNWTDDLLVHRDAAVLRLYPNQPPDPSVLAAAPGAATSIRISRAQLAFTTAVDGDDFAAAFDAAAELHLCAQLSGRESLPADLAWAAARTGDLKSAQRMLDEVLTRLPGVHPVLRPHYEIARALLALEQTDAAAEHGVLAFHQAWADGPPHHDQWRVAHARALLSDLGLSEPAPRQQSDPAPVTAELDAYIASLRARAQKPRGSQCEGP